MALRRLMSLWAQSRCLTTWARIYDKWRWRKSRPTANWKMNWLKFNWEQLRPCPYCLSQWDANRSWLIESVFASELIFIIHTKLVFLIKKWSKDNFSTSLIAIRTKEKRKFHTRKSKLSVESGHLTVYSIMNSPKSWTLLSKSNRRRSRCVSQAIHSTDSIKRDWSPKTPITNSIAQLSNQRPRWWKVRITNVLSKVVRTSISPNYLRKDIQKCWLSINLK